MYDCNIKKEYQCSECINLKRYSLSHRRWCQIYNKVINYGEPPCYKCQKDGYINRKTIESKIALKDIEHKYMEEKLC